ncbi:MAG: Gfo/Idh/MocA family oxidoreductase [Nanoarchaeota archaeon]|nr:Gfo/Idh/MocA family oxidoreductase [Nanoarchaeota archaeon]
MTEKGIVYIGFGKFARWHWLVKPSDIQITAIVDPGLHESVYLIQGQNPGEEVFYTLSELREAGLPGIDMQDLPGIDSPGVFLSSAQEINKFSEIPLKKSLVELIDKSTPCCTASLMPG